MSSVGLPLIVNLDELCVVLPLPIISLIPFQDLDMLDLLRSSCSSISSCSRFLRSEVNLLLNVLHICLFLSVRFFGMNVSKYMRYPLVMYGSLFIS